ncbi:hypothetical protein [Leptospira bouyouniensis]|uniref:hypothetical protein n=1 Tax=Leptospira bouyouniensis TaxID=2484911 RepID=UPI001091482F|nr:hypothetical protein [Leptospira bouyouniensis]TGM87123.1 hypothetical protein EHQ99_01115 [Leptospira bouyouniensis]
MVELVHILHSRIPIQIISGFQAEISLSYQIYDQSRLYFGYMRNQSKIRSINFDQTELSTGGFGIIYSYN